MGDRERRILAARPVVYRAARQFAGTPKHLLDHDDLVQVGMLAVVKAADRWDPDLAPWRSFAYRAAFHAMQDACREVAFEKRADQRLGRRARMLSLDAPMPHTDQLALEELLGVEDDPHDPFAHEAMTVMLDEMPTRMRDVAMWLRVGLNQRQIAEVIGVHPTRVSQLCTRIRRFVRDHPSMEGF
jgi:RNA polymerase sigma factor (sigma-70 family)